MTKRVEKEKEGKISEVDNKLQGLGHPKKKKGKIKILLILGVVFVIALIVFRKPLFNFVRDIPVIKKLMPETENKTEDISSDKLIEINKESEKEIDRLQEVIQKLEDYNENLKGKNESLKKYEEAQKDFLIQKNEWDKGVAAENEQLFIKQFEKIYPQTAEEIYKVIKGNEIVSKEKIEVSKAISEMDSEQAAKALEVLLSTDLDLVKNIMIEMKSTEKSQILESMSSEGAATVIKLIYP